MPGAFEAKDFFRPSARAAKWLHFMAAPLHNLRGQTVGAIETLVDPQRKGAGQPLNQEPRPCRPIGRHCSPSSALQALRSLVHPPSPARPALACCRTSRAAPYPDASTSSRPDTARSPATPCHATLADIPATLNLAVIATPPNTVCGIVEACAQRGIRAVVVLTDGLRPTTPAGIQLAETAARLKVRLFGPNALGYVLPHAGFNLTPITQAVPPGNLALVSQSAAVCANILDWNHNEEFGFSAIFAPGESDDIELPEILDYLAGDPKTESILLYLEGLRDARGFMSAVRAAASIKPVIAVKAGQHPLSSQIAEAHSGARAATVTTPSMQRCAVPAFCAYAPSATCSLRPGP